MQSLTFNIVAGIVTGLITAALLLVLRSLFFGSFLPWYRHVMFKGFQLDGSWYSVKRSQKVLLELNQNCEKITGKATVHLSKDSFGPKIQERLQIDDIRTFDVMGEVFERFVILRLKHTNRSRLGIVTYLLQIDGDGTKLTGQGSWYAPIGSGIQSGSEVFYRDESRAIKAKERERRQLAMEFVEMEADEDDYPEEVPGFEDDEEKTNNDRKADA